MQQSRIFVGMVLILIFAEVLGLYGSVHSANHPSMKRLRMRASHAESHCLVVISWVWDTADTVQSYCCPHPKYSSKWLICIPARGGSCTSISCKQLAQHAARASRDLDRPSLRPGRVPNWKKHRLHGRRGCKVLGVIYVHSGWAALCLCRGNRRRKQLELGNSPRTRLGHGHRSRLCKC
jgi:hypothetical protein